MNGTPEEPTARPFPYHEHNSEGDGIDNTMQQPVQQAPFPSYNATGEETQVDTPSDKNGENKGSVTKNRRGKLWTAIIVGILVLLTLMYVGYAYMIKNTVASGTRVAGIDIGGLTKDSATKKLDKEIEARLAQKITVTVGDYKNEITPKEYGVALDTQKTLNGTTGFSLNPAKVFGHLFGGKKTLEPQAKIDNAAYTSYINLLNEESGTQPVNASVKFEGTNPKVGPGKAGMLVNAKKAQTLLTSQAFEGKKEIALKLEETDPAVTDKIAQQFADTTAKTIVSGNVDVTVDEAKAHFTPENLASVTSFPVVDNKLTVDINAKNSVAILQKQVPEKIKPGKDARIEIVNHTTPQIIPSEDGTGIPDEELKKLLLETMQKSDAKDRVMTVKTGKVPAAFSTKDAEALGVKEVVAEISTPLTNDSVRTTNLRVGTKAINNTLVKPGETFSLEKALGEVDGNSGYVSSDVVVNGYITKALGGGLSQLATNTFNIGYLAGMENIEHKPHSKYFDRYPMGRESTFWGGQIDVKWKNRTPYGAVVEAYVENGRVVTKLWSTKYFEVTTTTSQPRNYRSPVVVHKSGPGCTPEPAFGRGFTVTVGRTVKEKGKVIEDSSYDWTYQPFNGVVCN